MEDNKKKRLAIGALILGIAIIVILSIVQLVKVGKEYKAEKEQIAAVKESASQLSDATNNLQNEMEEMLLQVDTMNAIIDVDKEMITKISSTTDDSSQTLAELEQKTTNLQKVLNQYLEEYKNSVNQTNEEILNSFDEINKDFDNINNIIANDNNQRNENYKTLKEAIEKTQNDVTNLLNKLSKQNKDEFKKLTEQITKFDEDLNVYMEDAKKKLLVTLDENYVQLNEHMDVVQGDLSLARQDIIDILNAIADAKSADYNDKFKSLEEHLDLVTTHFDEMLAELTDVINNLSAQNAEEHKQAIENLSAMQASLTDVENSSFNKMREDFTNAQKDYNEKIEKLGANVSEEFANTQAKLQNADEYRIGVISNANSAINKQFADNNNEINSLNKNLENNYIDYLGVLDSNNENLKDAINEYNDKVSTIYPSVANGKQSLVSAIETKYFPETISLKSDATFQEIADAIRNIPSRSLIRPNADFDGVLVIKAHFHEPNGTSAIKTFSSFAEYEAYLKAHPASGAKTSKTKGGCYSNAEHKDYEKTGTETYQSYEQTGTKEECFGVNHHTVCHVDGVETNWNGWNAECHIEYDNVCQSVPTYGNVTRTRDKYEWVPKGYYDLTCKYDQGEIISIQYTME